MQSLDDTVQYTVQQFVKDGLLFTGLDVSNEVKRSISYARHSEVSDLVRLSFASEMEPSGYAKTPINVTLRDGSVRTALLYHPLSDSWDLDSKYDAQKRAQVTVKPGAPVSASVAPNGTVTVIPPLAAPPLPTPVAAPVPPAQAWSQMFNSQPSLFPLK